MPAQFRADHVGSFLRPQELLDARANAAKDPQRLRDLEDLHVRRILDKQKELGFELATQGPAAARSDPSLAHGVNTAAGQLTNPAVAEALGRRAVPLEQALPESGLPAA